MSRFKDVAGKRVPGNFRFQIPGAFGHPFSCRSGSSVSFLKFVVEKSSGERIVDVLSYEAKFSHGAKILIFDANPSSVPEVFLEE